MNSQLTLALRLDDEFTFDNFYVGDNMQLVQQLKSFINAQSFQQFIFIWGLPSVGKSHLLQACCHALFEQQLATMYLNLSETDLSPQILQDLETMQLICLDDLHSVLGNTQWEEALFHFYNRLRDANLHLLVSAKAPPKQLNFVLPDLASRFNWDLVFQVSGLSDPHKLIALQLRAKQHGLILTNEVGEFLLRYYSRDMKKLLAFLEKLDQASLAEKRRLTIPFLKKVISC